MRFARLMFTAVFLWGHIAHAGPVLLGWENGNAGDIYVSEFILSADDIVARLRLAQALPIANFDLDKLYSTIHSAHLDSVEQVYLDQAKTKPADARNVPDQHYIEISRITWRELRDPKQTRERLRLVLHEFLFLDGYDDTHFDYSDALLTVVKTDDFSPGVFWNPLNPVNSISIDLEFNPGNCQIPYIPFDPSKTDEKVDMNVPAACVVDGAKFGSDDGFRHVVITKSSGEAPADSGLRGLFHTYVIQVLDRDGKPLGDFKYMPEWGACLSPEDGNCQLSGQITVGGVDFTFWFLRNKGVQP